MSNKAWAAVALVSLMGLLLGSALWIWIIQTALRPMADDLHRLVLFLVPSDDDDIENDDEDGE